MIRYTESIYFKMAIWYALVLGLLAGILGLAIFNNFKHTVNNDLNRLLRSKAEDINQIINGYNQDDRAVAKKWVVAEAYLINVDLPAAARFAIDNNFSDIFVRVFNPDGSEIAHSRNMSPALILATAPKGRFTSKDDYFSTSKVTVSKNNSTEFRSFTLPVIENEKVKYVIQVSVTLRHLLSQLARLQSELSLYIPLFIFIIIFCGLFLTKAALRPVDNMTRTIHQITSKNLNQRIKLTGANDEISRLAETFNEMLTRVDQAFSTQQQLLADISHELRTPLTVLKGKQEVALNKKRSQEEYAAVLRINLEEIYKMSQLVENLLILAQLEKKSDISAAQPVDLTGIISRVVNDMQILADQKNISLSFIPDGDIFIKADENQVSRVFFNIIDNAIKYTKNNGKVEVSMYKDKAYIGIEIRDTGIGIKEEELLHIFDRFYRADESRSSPGFGLGLSIVKSIIDAHKGEIRVESKLQEGTAFDVLLPLSR